ncbi:hypothetical protein U9M48_014123 [Paspalum notatum var. saurae]|uniref:Uncharacterized protein n=1 Tax=Paspalum notatum var. saurae TaxID=547442 RepID=A0AAQ3T3L3_PASNO
MAQAALMSAGSVHEGRAALLFFVTTIRETDPFPDGLRRMWRGLRETVVSSGRSGKAPACGEAASMDPGSYSIGLSARLQRFCGGRSHMAMAFLVQCGLHLLFCWQLRCGGSSSAE